MQQKINLSSPSTGLGDVLLLTAVCKNLLAHGIKPNVVLQNKIKRFAILFDGLADVGFGDIEEHTPDIGSGHYVTRKLRNFLPKAELLDTTPLVLHSDIESEIWAENFLANKKNPIIFVPNCAKQWHEIRSLKKNLIEEIIKDAEEQNCTLILCQNSSNPVGDLVENSITDLPLSKYISLLRKSGIYIGCNTGDMHLAVAVNASCTVFQPKDNPFFNSSEWNYSRQSINYISV